MLNILITAIAALFLSVALTGSAIAKDFSIHSQTDIAPVKITIQSKYDFEKQLSLKVRLDPSLIPSEQIIAIVNKLELLDTHGVKIHSGWDALKQHDIVLGWSGGTAEIIKAQQTADGLQIIASFKDANGNFVEPPEGMLAVYDFGGRRKCFAYEGVDIVAAPMVLSLLLDRSGSMAGHIEDVKRVARHFLDILPDTAQCSVGSFSDSYLNHAVNSYGNELCQSRSFDLSTMQAYGGTDLYPSLLSIYRQMNDAAYQNYQKAVIIVTDGAVNDTQNGKIELLQAKSDTLTFVFWLGEVDEQYLADLADGYFPSTHNVAAQLASYFDAIGNAYAKQKVLTIKDCGGQNAAP